MADKDIEFKNRFLRMEGDFPPSAVTLKNATIVEGMSMMTETKIEFLSSQKDLDIENIVGTDIRLFVLQEDDSDRKFLGTCISVEYVGLFQGFALFVAEVRPWLWFLTRTRENRIFQDLTVIDVIKEILGDYGFSSHLKTKLSETYVKRTYCVQYGETDFDFISRLMAEEGIYYYFEHEGMTEVMVIADSAGAHAAISGRANLEFYYREGEYRRDQDHIYEWNEVSRVTTGKVTLNDYDFENPRADQKKVRAIAKGKHSHKNYEHYRYPSHSVESAVADRFSRVRMEAEAVRHNLMRGRSNVRSLSVGSKFKMAQHPRKEYNSEYLLLRVVHTLNIETDYEGGVGSDSLFDSRIPVDEANTDAYSCVFDVISATEQYRAPFTTPWPEIPGMQTAIVTGPSGDEIYTDKYGRIKVQFHWDRLGEEDENTTCFVRCVMPWAGKNWGMIAIPRIGQEVAIQFEEGNPDRPICTGMLYNADNMPPYALPANATQTGIVTRSSKEGSAETFNELIFEDKKGEEFVRMQSEKDYKQTIKNNAVITVGVEKQDNGDLTQTIQGHKTETLNTGDHTFTVSEGNQIIDIATDHTETIGGNSAQTIAGNSEQTIDGDSAETVGGALTQDVGGDLTRTVGGNDDVTVSGNFSVTANGGKVDITATTSITLKVGASEVKIDASGVAIKGANVKATGTAMFEAGAPVCKVQASGMLTLKGSMTMIN